MYNFFLKRIIDFVFAFLILSILSPLLLILCIILLFTNKDGHIFFFQERPGLNTKIFKVIKFKTMTEERDDEGTLLPDGQRLTKTGRFLRSLSLDEIPQLINVIKGDMSLIGPRPLLIRYLPFYNKIQSRRHLIRPGITGWAQVNGRNAISWKEKLELDIWYVENMTFLLDVKIFFKTVYNVFKREGIYKGGDISLMEVFNGKN